MLYKRFTLFVLLLVLGFAVASRMVPAYAQDSRTFQPQDRSYGYRFQYPVQTHSVRTSNLAEPEGVDIPFGALVAVEPNDAYIYAYNAHPTYLTQMRILAGINAEPVDNDVDLTTYLGTSPLLHYNQADATIEDITLGNQPAVRASGIPVTPGEGTSEIIALFEGMLYEIVIEPVPLQLGFVSSDSVVHDPIIEAILNSWTFEVPAVE